MIIKSLYRDYFQKSRVFLYPLLEIKRGVSVTPIETFISWKDHYKPEDNKFICLYHDRNDEEFIRFCRTKLDNNKFFHRKIPVQDDKIVYVFDYGEHSHNIKQFLNGKYSQFSSSHKRKIKNFYGYSSTNYPYIESFLYPSKYFSIYAEMLNVDIESLKSVGELCSIPDLEKENLDVSILDKKIKKLII